MTNCKELPTELYIIALPICTESKEVLLQEYGYKRKKFLGIVDELFEGYISVYDAVSSMFVERVTSSEPVVWRHLATLREPAVDNSLPPSLSFYFIGEVPKETLRSFEDQERGLITFPIHHLPGNVPSTTRWLLHYAIDPFVSQGLPLNLDTSVRGEK